MNQPYLLVLAACLVAPFLSEPTGRECNAEAQDCVEETASVSLLQTDLTVSQISPHRSKDTVKKHVKSVDDSKTNLLAELKDFAVLQHSTHPLVVGKFAEVAAELPATAVLQHSMQLLPEKKSTEVAQLQQAVVSSVKRSSASARDGRVMVASGAVVMVVVLAVLAFFLVFGAAGMFKNIDPHALYRVDKTLLSSNAPAQDLLARPGQVPQTAPSRDPRVPPNVPPSLPGVQSQNLSSIGPMKAESAPALPAPSDLGSLFGLANFLVPQGREDSPQYLLPELVVQEPEGAMFFVDGLLTQAEQNGTVSVWRIMGQSEEPVLRVTMCEGYQGVDGHQNGITLELPRNTELPVAFINTQFALPRPEKGHHAVSKNRHCTIFDTFNHGLDFKNPFCTVEKEARGVALRRVSGEVICIVASGGYNTDFGNVVDDKGRLLATLSNRGHGMGGLGMVRGQWKENLRTVQIAQGVDVSIIVAAIICAAKLT